MVSLSSWSCPRNIGIKLGWGLHLLKACCKQRPWWGWKEPRKIRLGIGSMVTEGTAEGRVGGSDPIEPLGHWGVGMVSVMVGLHFPMEEKFIWYKITHFRMDNGVIFSDFRIVYDHSFCPFQDMLITPKGIPTPMRSPSQLSNPSPNDSSPVSLSLESPFLDAKETQMQPCRSLAWSSALYTQRPRDQIELTVTPNHWAHPNFLVPISWTRGMSRSPCFVCSVPVLQLVTTSVQLLQATSPLVLCILWEIAKLRGRSALCNLWSAGENRRASECNGDALDTGHTSSKSVLWDVHA